MTVDGCQLTDDRVKPLSFLDAIAC